MKNNSLKLLTFIPFLLLLTSLACAAPFAEKATLTPIHPTSTATPIPPTPTSTPIPSTPTPVCQWSCDINTETYGFDISCESGKYQVTINDSSKYNYDNGKLKTVSLDIKRERMYENTKNTYVINGTILVDLIEKTVDYNIKVSGGAFGDIEQICTDGDLQ